METVTNIYERNGVKDNCRFVKTPKAHWCCKDIVWKAIKQETEKMCWF